MGHLSTKVNMMFASISFDLWFTNKRLKKFGRQKKLVMQKKKKEKQELESEKKWWAKVVKWILGATLDKDPCFK